MNKVPNDYTMHLRRQIEGLLAEIELLHWAVWASSTRYKSRDFTRKLKEILKRAERLRNRYSANPFGSELINKVYPLIKDMLPPLSAYTLRAKRDGRDEVFQWLSHAQEQISRIEDALGKTAERYEGMRSNYAFH
jgi:hypothetical protein